VNFAICRQTDVRNLETGLKAAYPVGPSELRSCFFRGNVCISQVSPFLVLYLFAAYSSVIDGVRFAFYIVSYIAENLVSNKCLASWESTPPGMPGTRPRQSINQSFATTFRGA